LTTLAVQLFDPRRCGRGGEESMSTPEEQTSAPETGRRRTIWPNLVWGIPLAALVIVGYLGVRALLNRGEEVTVTFTRAAGAKAGVTKVLYQGVEAGQLTKIEPNADGRRLDFHLRLVPAAKVSEYQCPFLADRGQSQLFRFELARGRGLRNRHRLCAGEGGEPEDQFEGLDQAPLILPGDKGTRYLLGAHALNSIHEGSILLFHGKPSAKSLRSDSIR